MPTCRTPNKPAREAPVNILFAGCPGEHSWPLGIIAANAPLVLSAPSVTAGASISSIARRDLAGPYRRSRLWPHGIYLRPIRGAAAMRSGKFGLEHFHVAFLRAELNTH